MTQYNEAATDPREHGTQLSDDALRAVAGGYPADGPRNELILRAIGYMIPGGILPLPQPESPIPPLPLPEPVLVGTPLATESRCLGAE